MTLHRQIEIQNEAIRRCNLWLTNATFMDMSVDGSLLRFDMSLGLFGYPFVKEKWMIKFNKFVTQTEYVSKEYDIIVNNLFNQNK